MSDEAKSDKKLCFVIGPIGDPGTEVRRHASWVLDGIIKPVLREHFPDFRVERADEIVSPGSISSQVITRLMDAPLVIADMSLHNANAFYELAVRHMKMLPTIHLTHKDWKIPFDVAPYRAITFSYEDPAEVEKAQTDLRSTEVIKPGFQVENPITYARGRLEFDQHATPEKKLLLDAIETLSSRVSKVEEAQAVNNRAIETVLSQPPPVSLSGAFGKGAYGGGLVDPEVIRKLTSPISPEFLRALAGTGSHPPTVSKKKGRPDEEGSA